MFERLRVFTRSERGFFWSKNTRNWEFYNDMISLIMKETAAGSRHDPARLTSSKLLLSSGSEREAGTDANTCLSGNGYLRPCITQCV